MAMTSNDKKSFLISSDDARGAVTDHNVRYVLAYGLVGIVVAFSAIAIFFGAGRLASAVAPGPVNTLYLLPYASIALMATLATGILLSMVNEVLGDTDDGSQKFMRFRVVSQFTALVAIFAMTHVAPGI